MLIDFPINIIKGTFSIPKSKDQKYIKAKLQRIVIKNENIIQLALYSNKQVFHENLDEKNIADRLNELMNEYFNNAEIETTDYIYGYRITNKGKLLTNKRKNNQEFVVLEHNKKKKYLLEEGKVVPPLVDLGVMTIDGKIVKSHYDKYK